MQLTGRILKCIVDYADFKVGQEYIITAHFTDGQIEVFNKRRARFSVDKKDLDYYGRYFILMDDEPPVAPPEPLPRFDDYIPYKNDCYIKQLRDGVYHAILIEDDRLYMRDDTVAVAHGQKLIGVITVDFVENPKWLSNYGIDVTGGTKDKLYRYATYRHTLNAAAIWDLDEQWVVSPCNMKEKLHEITGSDAVYRAYQLKHKGD